MSDRPGTSVMEQRDNEHETFEFFTPTKDLEDPVVTMPDPFDVFIQKHDVEPSGCPPKKKRLQMKVRTVSDHEHMHA